MLRQAEPDLVDVAAPDRLAEAFEEIGDAQRRHEQDDAVLIDQMAQHQELDRVGERDHDQHREHERERERMTSDSRASDSAANSTIAPWAKEHARTP